MVQIYTPTISTNPYVKKLFTFSAQLLLNQLACPHLCVEHDLISTIGSLLAFSVEIVIPTKLVL